ncbi:hypothetical protein SLS62_001882 [Diatrype stigma]|uniref:Uncharacterized protein n=1 Tax=Diatrype stigma TaxID=117547 RepID=A0AAN9UV29_9PEZI
MPSQEASHWEFFPILSDKKRESISLVENLDSNVPKSPQTTSLMQVPSDLLWKIWRTFSAKHFGSLMTWLLERLQDMSKSPMLTLLSKGSLGLQADYILHQVSTRASGLFRLTKVKTQPWCIPLLSSGRLSARHMDANLYP